MRSFAIFSFASALAALCGDIATATPIDFSKRQSSYPPAFATPPRSMTPQAWIDALNAAVAQGKIPSLPQSLNREGPLAYPAGTDPGSSQVCNWSYNNCQGPRDIHSAPSGTIAMNFDDGPSVGTPMLLDFLQQQNQSATHFLIGSNILNNPDQFGRMSASPLHQLAVHTWSHPSFITALSNEDIVAELGWTMQIIADRSGGRVPNIWRAPQGDLDNRVRAIAENVFNLVHVSWTADSSDWRFGAGANFDQIAGNVRSAFQQRAPGSGMIILEHELYTQAVQVFQQVTWPLLHQNNLKPETIGDMNMMNLTGWYSNARNNNDSPASRSNILPVATGSSSSSTVQSTSMTTLLSTATSTATAAPTATSLPNFPSASTVTVTGANHKSTNGNTSGAMGMSAATGGALFAFVASVAMLLA